MDLFDFHPTTRVVYGRGSLPQLGDQVKALGANRALLVTDTGLVEVGHAEHAEQILRDAKIDVFRFGGVEENPTTDHVNAGVAAAERAGDIQCIIALGGGSAMDCAKGINFLLTNGGRMEDYWGVGKARKPMLPSVGIPTTAGTGSEAQSFALISQAGTHAKMACGDIKARFSVAILDPVLVRSVPRDVAAATGIDAITHALESYVTTKRNPISQMFAREAWRLLEKHIERVLGDPDDLTAWGNMQLGAHFAGAAIESSMLGAAHACANPLTAHYDIPHGVAVGLMLPHVMEFNIGVACSLYDELALVAGIRASGRHAAEALIERLRSILRAADQPENLRDLNVDHQMLDTLAGEAETQWTGKHNPLPVDRAGFLALYERAF